MGVVVDASNLQECKLRRKHVAGILIAYCVINAYAIPFLFFVLHYVFILNLVQYCQS